MTASLIFFVTYIGIALGRVPGLVLDRVGIALLGAIAMVVAGVLSVEEAVFAIDLPTILLLYALMILSAQLRLGGFYTRDPDLLQRTRCGRNTGHVAVACRRAAVDPWLTASGICSRNFLLRGMSP
jgi:hypothetical protein